MTTTMATTTAMVTTTSCHNDNSHNNPTKMRRRHGRHHSRVTKTKTTTQTLHYLRHLLLVIGSLLLLCCGSFLSYCDAANNNDLTSITDIDYNSDEPITFETLQSLIVNGFVDTARCYDAIESAVVVSRSDGLIGPDVRRMDIETYVLFVKSYGPDGFLDDVTSFEGLPLILKSNFNILACLCQSDPNDDSCCVGDKAGIDTDGSFEDELASPTEQSYLFLVCSLTSVTIDRVIQSSPPSAAPTTTPSPTTSPTVSPVPTESPTPIPTTPYVINVTYGIAIRNGTDSTTITTFDEYDTDLISAMNSLAPEVLQEVVVDDGRRQRQRQLRQLRHESSSSSMRSSEHQRHGIGNVNDIRSLSLENLRQRILSESAAAASASLLSNSEISTRSSSHNSHHEQYYHRRLRSVQLDTTIVNVTEIDCPSGIPPEDRCENITASVVLLFQPNDQDPDEVAETFEMDLNNAISNGRLQGFLNNPGIYILDDNALGNAGIETARVSNSDTISGGGVAGIVIGSLAIVGVGAYLVIGRRGEPKEELEQLQPAPRDLELDEGGNKAVGGDDEEDPATIKVSSVAVKAVGSVGVKKATVDYTQPVEDSSNKGVDDMSNVDGDDGASSNAGSSGWSSSAGLSSLNTGSHDDGLDPFEKPSTGSVGGGGGGGVIGSTLKALKEADSGSPDSGSPEAPNMNASVTRADLDNAIEAGDWAAVGATAALLAAASDSQSYTSHSEHMVTTRSQSGSSVSSLDAARAAELDHLVDAGDWEGVVLAAAKYENDEGETTKSQPSESVSEAGESRSNTDTAGQTADSSVGSSKALKQQEYRAIVEDLVQRVVPEEIQNVDEMMLQFRGREDELVETLRTMQERAVAQKARHSSQRAAKQQAKMAAKTNKSLGTGQVTSQAAAKSLGTGQLESSTKSKSLGTGTILEEEAETKPASKTALEDAIERGDWNAVGDAAAMLADASSSVGTDEIDRLAEGISTDGSSVGGQSEAAAELEELIEAGDWTGIVQAASTQQGTTDGNAGATDDVEARRKRRMKHLQDEQNALAQAEIWTAIAEHSLSGSETHDQGAADATDWAISRSLNALVEAEQSGVLDPSEGTNSLPGTDERNEV